MTDLWKGKVVDAEEAHVLASTAIGVRPVNDTCFFFVLPGGKELRYEVASVSTGYCDTCAGHDTEITWTLYGARLPESGQS